MMNSTLHYSGDPVGHSNRAATTVSGGGGGDDNVYSPSNFTSLRRTEHK